MIFFSTTTSTTNNITNPLSSSAPLPPALLKKLHYNLHYIQIVTTAVPCQIEGAKHSVNKAAIVLEIFFRSGVAQAEAVLHTWPPFLVRKKFDKCCFNNVAMTIVLQ